MERSSPASGGTRPWCCGHSGLAHKAREWEKVRRLVGLLRNAAEGCAECLPCLPNAPASSWWIPALRSTQGRERRTIGELRAG